MEYLLTCLAAGSASLVPLPPAALDQARYAANSGVALNVVLRRYTAGDLAVRRILAWKVAELPSGTISNALNIADEAIDTVLRCAAAEFEAEAARLSRSATRTLATTLGLLKDEINVSELDGYILDRWHIGAVTESSVSRASLSQLAASIGGQVFVVDGQRGQRWIWIGKSQRVSSEGVAQALKTLLTDQTPFGLGEARRGLSGWRLTHTEARIAAELPGADRRTVTRMRRHLLEAAVLGSSEFTQILIATYIEPLEAEPNKVAADLRTTLEAYLKSGRNAKSAAEYLGIDRHTVVRRLKKVESLVEERLEDCSAQFEVALQIAMNLE